MSDTEKKQAIAEKCCFAIIDIDFDGSILPSDEPKAKIAVIKGALTEYAAALERELHKAHEKSRLMQSEMLELMHDRDAKTKPE
jgi:hypothetical protein